jgi:hypothetical protein
MQIGIPQLQHSLSLKPILADQQAVHHARGVIIVRTADFAGGFGGLDDRGRDDIAVRTGDAVFGEFAGNDGFELVFQAEGDERDFFGWYGRSYVCVVVGREETVEFIVETTAAVAIAPFEPAERLACERGFVGEDGLGEGIGAYLGHLGIVRMV